MFGLTNLKLIAIGVGLLALITAIAVPAFKLGGSSVREEVQADADKRVAAVKEGYDKATAAELALTDHYRTLSDGKYDDLIKKVTNIKVVNTTVTNNITKERADNPAFYLQLVPPGGIKQWEDARNLFR